MARWLRQVFDVRGLHVDYNRRFYHLCRYQHSNQVILANCGPASATSFDQMVRWFPVCGDRALVNLVFRFFNRRETRMDREPSKLSAGERQVRYGFIQEENSQGS